MFIKQLGALFSSFLLLAFFNADAEKRVRVACQVTYAANPVCSAQGDITYRVIGIHPETPGPGHRGKSINDYGIMGIGDSFSSAWEDAHRVCEKRGCHITSCDYEETFKVFSSLGVVCKCSYRIGNTCGGRIGDTGEAVFSQNVSSFISSLVEKADQICERKLRETPNVPAEAVSFSHDCLFGGRPSAVHIAP